MKAALLNTVPGVLEITEVTVDSPGPREVLIRTVAAGLCHSDLHLMEGGFPCPTPAVLGHESAGIVEEVGSDVAYVRPGDHVITCLSVFCGQCEFCISGRPNLCTKDATRRRPGAPARLQRDGQPVHQALDLSSFAEQMLVHEGAVVKIPQDVGLDVAALVGCGVTTGLGAVLNTANVRPGDTVAVIGCGGVGLSVVQGAVIAGASRIIAVDRVSSKLEVARSFGATDVVDPSSDPVEEVLEMTGGGVVHAFEAVGSPTAVAQAFDMLRSGGTATIVGIMPVGAQVSLPGLQFLREKRLQGSNMGSNRFRIDMPKYLQMYRDGRLKLDEMISARIALEDINTGFEQMKAGAVVRSVVMFAESP